MLVLQPGVYITAYTLSLVPVLKMLTGSLLHVGADNLGLSGQSRAVSNITVSNVCWPVWLY